MRQSAASLPVQSESPHRSAKAPRPGFVIPMPQLDPNDAQNGICEAIARLTPQGQPEVTHLEALFALDKHAQPVIRLLLTQYVEGHGGVAPFEWMAWHSASRLTRSLSQAYEYFLQHIRNTISDAWALHESAVMVQLFDHRKAEFLLRFFRYKKRNAEHWKQLHEWYRIARERPVLNRGATYVETHDEHRAIDQVEQQYLQMLLLEAMNGGQFSPIEGLSAHRWFERWCSDSELHLVEVDAARGLHPQGFVVDLDGSDGLRRSGEDGGKDRQLLYFDPSPLCATIDREIAALKDEDRAVDEAVRNTRGQLALLNRLSILFSPNPVSFERRSVRRPVSVAVRVIAGFSNIVAELHKNGHAQNYGTLSAAPTDSEDTISPDGSTFSPLFAADAGLVLSSSGCPVETIPQIWQVKDRSDSGCRMRAQIDNLNQVIPGSLIVVRDRETSPWTVAVVRWFRRLVVDHVEIGVEYLGRTPRFVKVVADAGGDYDYDGVPANVGPDSKVPRCYAALYLPPSDKHPAMPIKTMLLPARDFTGGCNVTLLSSSATHRVRLSEPIQQHFEYIWTSFAVVDKVMAPSK